MIITLIIALVISGLYCFAGTSDRLDELTQKQRAEVVDRWH